MSSDLGGASYHEPHFGNVHEKGLVVTRPSEISRLPLQDSTK